MARLSSPVLSSSTAVEQVDVLLDQLLRGPVAEQKDALPSDTKECGALAALQFSPGGSMQYGSKARRGYTPNAKTEAQNRPRSKTRDGRKLALAAASPVALPQKWQSSLRTGFGGQETGNRSSSITSDTASIASSDSGDRLQTALSYAEALDFGKAETGSHRQYWPKYDGNGVCMALKSRQDLCGVALRKQKAVEREKAKSKILPLPIPINANAGVLGKSDSSLDSQKPSKVKGEVGSITPWRPSPSSSCPSDEDDQQAKTVEETLMYLYPSLQGTVPDVLIACDNDGTAAFEKLQQMLDTYTEEAFALTSPMKEEPSFEDKVCILAGQYESASRGDIAACLLGNNGDLDQSSTDLLARKLETEAKVEANDRALAAELSQDTGGAALATPGKQLLPHISQEAAPASPAFDHWLDTADEATKMSFQHLNACFPSVALPVIQSALLVSKGEVDFAKEILRDEGHEEVPGQVPVPTPVRAPTPFQARIQQSVAEVRIHSPPKTQQPFWPNYKDHQAIYEKHRAESRVLAKRAVEVADEVARLEQQRHYMEASLLRLEVQKLKHQQRAANNLAKEDIFESMNKDNCTTREIDLHGLHTHEAIEKVHQLVEFSVKDPFSDTFAKLVTGRGKGSPHQISKLRPAVEEYLEKRGILHGLEPGNSGVVCIKLTCGQKLKPYQRVWH